MGQEFAGKGVNIALAPAMGIAVRFASCLSNRCSSFNAERDRLSVSSQRNADGGRNFESFGAGASACSSFAALWPVR